MTATTTESDLPGKREALCLDARSAAGAGESCAEWEQSLDRASGLSAAVKAVGPAGMRAIVCMVWKIDRKARER